MVVRMVLKVVVQNGDESIEGAKVVGKVMVK